MGRLDRLGERCNAGLSLPYCAMQEIISRLGLLDREEREYRAQHEAGHATVYFLAGQPIETAQISRLRGMTTAHLNTVLSPFVTINAGEVSLREEDERQFAKEHPDRNALMYLAGMASTQDPKHTDFFAHIVNKELALGREATWDDIGVPYAYIADRFMEIHQREPENNEVIILFQNISDKMKEIFQNPKFAQSLTILKQQIERSELKGDINSKIRHELERNGLDEGTLAQMQEQLFSIDIDQVIRDFNFGAEKTGA